MAISLMFSGFLFGQSPITLQLDNQDPIEGCDIVTFTVTVCNVSANARQAVVRIIDMEYFEYVDLLDFENGNVQESFVELDLGTMTADECRVLQFQAMAMTDILFDQSPPGPIVRGGVKFLLGGVQTNHNTSVACVTQGYKVLDGRWGGFSMQTAISNGYLPSCNDVCIGLEDIAKITVLGTLLIDVDSAYCLGSKFGNGEIIMGEGAEIVIKTGSELWLNVNHIESCNPEKMCRQILVESGAFISLREHSQNYAYVRGGTRALSLEGGSAAHLRRTIFENNHVGLFIDGIEFSKIGGVNLPVFSDLTFRADDSYLDGLAISDLRGHPDAPLDRAFAGIVVKNCDYIGLGNPNSAAAIKYNGLLNGIWATNANITLGYSEFWEIHEESSIEHISGFGINSRSSSINPGNWLEVKKSPSGYAPRIQRTTKGIFTSLVKHVDLTGVKMDRVREAISTTSVSGLSNITVQDCELTNIKLNGIQHNGSGKLKYLNNDVQIKNLDNLTMMNGQAIETSSPFIYINHNIDISDNQVDLHTAKGGIRSVKSTGIIRENTVTMQTSDNAITHGINWQNPTKATLQCNVVTGTAYSGLSQTDALYVGNSSAATVSCNAVDEVGVGIRLFGMNDGMLIRSNEFNDHQLGLAYGYNNPADQTITGQQSLRGNLWPTMHSNAAIAGRYGAIHYGSGFYVNNSKFNVNNSVDQTFMPKWTANGDWFNPDDGTNQDCNENNEPICEMGPGVIGPNLPDDIDVRIMQDSMPHPEWQYTGSRRLMQRIVEDPDLLEDTDLADFYSDAIVSYLGEWHDVDQQIRNAWVMDTSLQAALETQEATLHSQIALIREAQDSLAGAGTEVDSLYWFAQLDTLYWDYQELYADWSALSDSVIQIAVGRLTQARTDNANLSTSEIWLENEQATRHIALSLAIDQRDTLSGAELSTLQDIAEQCPTWGGDAVYQARAILMGAGTYAWDDVVLCAEAEERASLSGRPYMEALHVQPNPASDHITIMTDAEIGASLRLIDMFGRVVLQQPYMGYGQRLDTGGLPTGRYVLQLFSQAGKVHITALQIAR